MLKEQADGVSMKENQKVGQVWRGLARLAPWWAALFGLVGTGTCPCCGQPGCPNGAAGAGLCAVLAAWFLMRLPWVDRKSHAGESPHAKTEKEEAAPL